MFFKDKEKIRYCDSASDFMRSHKKI